MKKINLILFIILALLACSENDSHKDLEQLASYMIGSFDSKEQSLSDTNFFNIHLEMARIWEGRDDAIWLYVEQAAAWALDKPYRQRVYKLSSMDDGKIISEVFVMNDPLRFVGSYKDDNIFNNFTPDSLNVREGCAILLEKEGDAFVGSTEDKKCKSNLRGAAYATSEVRIEKDVIKSWDRGWDTENKQVWGAVTGPYIFKKKSK